MTDNIESTLSQAGLYTSPQMKVISIKAQGVLCQSGNEWSMRESDLGDAGFSEV